MNQMARNIQICFVRFLIHVKVRRWGPIVLYSFMQRSDEPFPVFGAAGMHFLSGVPCCGAPRSLRCSSLPFLCPSFAVLSAGEGQLFSCGRTRAAAAALFSQSPLLSLRGPAPSIFPVFSFLFHNIFLIYSSCITISLSNLWIYCRLSISFRKLLRYTYIE
jgi:hypothetical protein